MSCVINNEVQQRIINRRKNIKQGCQTRSSTQMYSYASDPLLLKLNKVLKPVAPTIPSLGSRNQ